jgi:hypothetical protein
MVMMTTHLARRRLARRRLDRRLATVVEVVLLC